MEKITKIPKIIHYCWFGGNSLPEMAQRCIASWKKYCPDYEIVEWNEDNFDINVNDDSWKLIDFEEFNGSSHEKITREIYRRTDNEKTT